MTMEISMSHRTLSTPSCAVLWTLMIITMTDSMITCFSKNPSSAMKEQNSWTTERISILKRLARKKEASQVVQPANRSQRPLLTRIHERMRSFHMMRSRLNSQSMRSRKSLLKKRLRKNSMSQAVVSLIAESLVMIVTVIRAEISSKQTIKRNQLKC